MRADRFADTLIEAGPRAARQQLQPTATSTPGQGEPSQDGNPIVDSLRPYFEASLGTDLRHIRVHSDDQASELTHSADAEAFTVGRDIYFGRGRYDPQTLAGRHLIAHELAHVVQSSGGSPYGQPRIWRKVKVRGPNEWLVFKTWHELTRAQRHAFVAKRFPGDTLALAIIDDMGEAADEFKFENADDLGTEIFKRADTSRRMRESQKDLGPHGKSFGYPSHTGKGCGPRVNKAARKYWGPVKTDDDSYYFELSPDGKKDAYRALTTLFTPQANQCDRTLIHCDYLASVVHYRVFAETIGIKQFNDRVLKGKLPLTLKWNGFDDLEKGTFRSSKRESLQQVRPSSEKDLVIGDHVIFWNHVAYDLLNENVGEAWRLENAVLVDKKGMDDIFLGHGSDENTNMQMRHKLAQRYNEVVKKAQLLIAKTVAKDPKQHAAALKQLDNEFPHVVNEGKDWRIKGWRSLFNRINVKLQPIKATDPLLAGLRDPDDPGRMNKVWRPVESNR